MVAATGTISQWSEAWVVGRRRSRAQLSWVRRHVVWLIPVIGGRVAQLSQVSGGERGAKWDNKTPG